jgi:fructosamine-3-kinase
VDLAYFRAHPQHLPAFLKHQRIRETPVAGGSICNAIRLTLDDGGSAFAKTWPDKKGEPGKGIGSGRQRPPEGFFEVEAAGLRWLREAGAVPVPEVIAALPTMLVLEWINSGPATPGKAEQFGRDLAALHRAGADAFGAPWDGFIGSLPLPNELDTGAWPQWFARCRLAPYLKISADRGALDPAEVAAVERVLEEIEEYAGPAGAEPPARLHGDLWPGNLLWSTDRVWLIDPAAQGGHRETDLANLALFGGAPHLDRILAGYQEVWPLAEGWRRRIPLHQLHLLLVHAALFGGTYARAVLSAVRDTVVP